MRVQFALAAILVTGLALGLPAQQSPSSSPQTPVFRSGAAFVRVDVYPSKDGRIIPGLTRNDFQIFEDGKPQTIETFDYVNFPTFASEEERRDPVNKEEGDALAGDPRNRVFVVYLDTFHVSIAEGYRARQPLIAWLDRTIGPSDVFSVMTPQQTLVDLVFGRKVKSTGDMLTRHWVWGDSDSTPVDQTAIIMRACYAGRMDDKDINVLIAREREDRNFQRLRELVDYLGRLRQERKNLLIFTHGWDLAGPAPYLMTAIDRAPSPPRPTVTMEGKLAVGDRSRGSVSASTCETERVRLANADFRDRFRELLDAAKRANVSFYPINPAGIDPDVARQDVFIHQAGYETATDHLRELAADTDGIAVIENNDLRTSMMRITDSLSAYYLIGYYPTNSKQDGSLRSITVKGPAGVDVRARRQYVAADEKDDASHRKAAAALAPATTAAVASDVDAAFEELTRAAATRADITARAVMTGASEMTVVAESARPATGDVDLQLVVSDQAGNSVASGRGRIAAGARSVAMRATMPASSRGPWQAVMRVSGGDLRGGETMAVSAPDGMLVGPLVLRIDGANTAPVAAAIFSRRERVRVTWTSTDSVAFTTHDARVLDRRGQPLPIDAMVTTAPSGTKTAISVDVALAPLAPGDYVVELVVAAGEKPVRRLLAIRVTQ